MWTPFTFEPQIKKEHHNHYLRVLALLKPGVSREQADSDLDQIAKRVEQQYPDGAGEVPLVEISHLRPGPPKFTTIWKDRWEILALVGNRLNGSAH